MSCLWKQLRLVQQHFIDTWTVLGQERLRGIQAKWDQCGWGILVSMDELGRRGCYNAELNEVYTQEFIQEHFVQHPLTSLVPHIPQNNPNIYSTMTYISPPLVKQTVKPDRVKRVKIASSAKLLKIWKLTKFLQFIFQGSSQSHKEHFARHILENCAIYNLY